MNLDDDELKATKEKTADEMFDELEYIEHFNTEYAECYRKDSSHCCNRQIGFNVLNKNVMVDYYISQDELKAINKKCEELRMALKKEWKEIKGDK